MGKIFLAGFKAGKNRYEHVVDSVTNETSLHVIDTEITIFRVNAGGWMYNKHGAMAGRFTKMDNGCWKFKTIDGSMGVNTKFVDIFEAQRDVFTVLLQFGYKE